MRITRRLTWLPSSNSVGPLLGISESSIGLIDDLQDGTSCFVFVMGNAVSTRFSGKFMVACG